MWDEVIATRHDHLKYFRSRHGQRAADQNDLYFYEIVFVNAIRVSIPRKLDMPFCSVPSD